MSTETFDAIIVGAGQAGPAIAARCSREGLRTAVIERGAFGGTCVNVGCVPTKTLVASARAAQLARRGSDFGFDAGAVRVDMARVMARKDRIVEQSREGVEAWMRGLAQAEVIVGEARFVAPSTLEVGGRRLSAPRIFLNVGGSAAPPALPGIDEVEALDNVSILQLREVPEHLVIVGGSYIGLEFAQMMRRFGAQVTVVEQSPRLLPARGRGRLAGDPLDPRSRRRALRDRLRVHLARARRRARGGRRGLRRRAPAHRRQPPAAGHRPAPEHRRPRARRRGHPHR